MKTRTIEFFVFVGVFLISTISFSLIKGDLEIYNPAISETLGASLLLIYGFVVGKFVKW
jgi:hypothetical protein